MVASSEPVQAAASRAQGVMARVFSPLAPQQPDKLEDRLDDLYLQYKRMVFVRRVLASAGLVAVTVAASGLFIDSIASVRWLVLGAVFFVVRELFYTADVQDQLIDLEFKSRLREFDRQLRAAAGELAKRRPEEEEHHGLLHQRAYELFSSHVNRLRLYYDQARRQSRVMLITGLLCLGLGVGIVVVAGWVILAPPEWVVSATGTGTQGGGGGDLRTILATALGAIGGILANYVAAVYLRMFAATSQLLNDFHNRLVSTQHILFGNYVGAGIRDEGKRDDALASMAVELARL